MNITKDERAFLAYAQSRITVLARLKHVYAETKTS
jgi:hypothetical protein